MLPPSTFTHFMRVCLQVWELDKKLLQSHALPLVWAYTYETATVMRALDMDDGGPAPAAAAAAAGSGAAAAGAEGGARQPRAGGLL
jgi:hypothetical protein